MTDTNPVPHTRKSAPPPGSDILSDDVEREPARRSSRQSERLYQAPEPHEKYHLYPDEIPSGMDAMWLPTSVIGQPNSRAISEAFRSGWQPAKAADFPRISGFGVEYPQEMIDAGFLENAKPNAPIVVDEQMLVLRPLDLSKKYQRKVKTAADEQVDNQMRRLRQASRGFRGTEVRRQHAPLPDSARYEDDE